VGGRIAEEEEGQMCAYYPVFSATTLANLVYI